jgi:hypothetical protein
MLIAHARSAHGTAGRKFEVANALRLVPCGVDSRRTSGREWQRALNRRQLAIETYVFRGHACYPTSRSQNPIFPKWE